MMSTLMCWCSYRECNVKEQKDAMPCVDALTAFTSNNFSMLHWFSRDLTPLDVTCRHVLTRGDAPSPPPPSTAQRLWNPTPRPLHPRL
jgi:hypothetical protein